MALRLRVETVQPRELNERNEGEEQTARKTDCTRARREHVWWWLDRMYETGERLRRVREGRGKGGASE